MAHRRRTHRTWLGLALAGCLVAGPAGAQTEIVLWHAMGGALGDKVDDVAAGFNASQSRYVLTAEHKGTYTETLSAAVEAFAAGEQPHLLHVFDVGIPTMLAAEGFVYPLHQMMADLERDFDAAIYVPAVAGYYGDPSGNLLALPFNTSTPVMYYDRQVFAEAGYEQAPATWPELAEALLRVQENGTPCGFTTAWQSWIQIENFSAWHNVPVATRNNGFAGPDAELLVNGDPQVAHIEAMADWANTDLFRYGGRRGEARSLFLSGDCAAYFNSSAGYATINANADFDFGVAPLPYWPEIAARPRNSIVGGAALWTLQGRDEADYAGVAAFVDYFSSPAIQADWHQFTGYLPITREAYELTRDQGYYDANPGTDVGMVQMIGRVPTSFSVGPRLGGFVEIREILNEELEAVWAGEKTARQALDAAAERGNEVLRAFEAENDNSDSE